MRVVLFWIVFLLFLFPLGTVSAARAVSIQVSGDSFLVDEPFLITASASGFSEGEILHIKGAFFMAGSTNYFGFSKVGDDAWTANIQSASNQPKVVIGTWNNALSVKGDGSDSGYQGEGEYLIKLGYYYITATGTISPVQWSVNTIPIMLRDPVVTPTPSPAPIPTHTPTPVIRPTDTPSPTATSKPTVIPTKIIPTSAQKSIAVASPSSDILGVHATAAGSGRRNMPPVPVGKVLPRSVFALLFLGVGMAISAFALAVQKTSLWKNLQEPNR